MKDVFKENYENVERKPWEPGKENEDYGKIEWRMQAKNEENKRKKECKRKKNDYKAKKVW